MEEETLANEPNFQDWPTIELFNHLIDLFVIPYEAEYSEWKHYRQHMIKMCQEGYENRTI